MEPDMSDTTHLIAPPDEQEGVAPAEVAPTETPAAPEVAAPELPVSPEAPAVEAASDEAAAPATAALDVLRKARDERRTVEGRVFGWNPGGFHVVIDGLAAFCPRSEMELDPIADPEAYLDKTFAFRVLKIQGKGRRIVLSRTALLREEQEKQASATVAKLRAGSVVQGKVASLTDFGAFVDVGGGVEGLVHVSEISRERVNKPADRLHVGQEVEVKVLKVEKGGKRLSLSIKALEPDPWREIREKYPEGAVVEGKVERTDKPGAFIQLEPGLVGLLPTSEMGLPREAIAARAYPKGKTVRVQVVGIDPKRRRISLAPEGSQIEGTRGDYQAYLKQQRRETEASGFNALASALSKLKRDQ
jgi:ribosomal protein S1